jgi:hypothetical protein
MTIAAPEILRGLGQETYPSIEDFEEQVRKALWGHWKELPAQYSVGQFLDWVYDQGWAYVDSENLVHITITRAQTSHSNDGVKQAPHGHETNNVSPSASS